MASERNFIGTMQDQVVPFAKAIGNSRPLTAIRNGLSKIIPLIIVGSIFLLLQHFPISGYEAFMVKVLGSNFATLFEYAANATLGLVGIASSFTIADSLATAYKEDGRSAGLISMASFLVLIPITAKNGNFPFKLLGTQGLFVAIIVSLSSANIYHVLSTNKIYTKLPASVPPNVVSSFKILLPAFTSVLLFTLIHGLIVIAGWGSAFSIIQKIIGGPLESIGTSYYAGLVSIFMIQFFWIFGIHGSNIINPIMMPIWLAAADQNRLAFQTGQPCPNIIAQPFFDNLLWCGGSGALISLAILMKFFSKSRQFKELGKIGFVPTIFAVNEIFMFGIPIVSNATILIPYLIVPIIDYNILYFATYFRIIPRVTGIILPWTTPPLINGFLVTGSLTTVLLQSGMIILSMAIYYPFFRKLDNQHLKESSTNNDVNMA